MPEYTLLAVAAVVGTVGLEAWSRTRVFAKVQFWVTIGIVFGFQVLVDGWLTKLSAPIVIYHQGHYLGLRWPWDVPVEDYLFGFAMVTSVIILWERAKNRAAREPGGLVSDPVTPCTVPAAFDQVADRYDLMVGLSPGYHRQLRRSAQALIDTLGDRAPRGAGPARLRLLDLGCGSGASTRAVVDAIGCHGDLAAATVLGVDGSGGMLARARAKAWPPWVSFAVGLAQDLPAGDLLQEARAAGGLDGVLAAYLVRNVPDRDAVLAAICGALRPGGVLVVHEYTVRGRPLPALVWTLVCWGVIIPLGRLTCRRTRLYRYLWRSVLSMDSTARLEDRLRGAGFTEVTTRPVPGWQRGIVHTLIARRPG